MSTRIAALLVVLAAALTLGASAGAGTASQPPKKIDLTNPTAVNNYLTSIGVDPATVVRQVGLFNYAGPAAGCPGVGWNCTTSSKAVQVSSAGGQNKFKCSPDQGLPTNPDTNTCVIMQGGPDNKAQCQMKDTGEPIESQQCVVDQTGAQNLAIVDELIEQGKGPEQDARQIAEVSQKEGERNQSQIHQDVKQDTKVTTDTGLQDQTVHQVALVYQQANGSENFSHVHQNQDLSASGAATTQNQNVTELPVTGPPIPSEIRDCDPTHKSTNPNACANVIQIAGMLEPGSPPVVPPVITGAGGRNESHLHQNIHEHAKTTASPSTQMQETADSGIEGHVDQENPPGLGTNHKIAHEDGRQWAEGGPETTQIQTIDPNCCGVGTTVGGADNQDVVDQKAIQSASRGADAIQNLGITSDTDHEVNPLPPPPPPPPALSWLTVSASSSNTCRFHQDGRNNEASVHFTLTFDPCEGIHIQHSHCESTAALDEEGVGRCTPPPGTETSAAVTVLPSSATLGNPIDPPNFGEPSDFPGPIFPGI